MSTARTSVSRERASVVIAGGGVAAVESLLALRALVGRGAEITLLSPEDNFLYRPVTVAEAFERGEAREYALEDILAEQRGKLAKGRLVAVRPDRHEVITAEGDRITYEVLIIAVGAIAQNRLRGALSFRGRQDVGSLREILGELVAGKARSVAFTVPSERIWPLPIYELALMTAGYLREQNTYGRNVWLVTPEEEPLELFGPTAKAAIEPMLAARGITLRTSSRPAVVHGRTLMLAGGGEILAERVVTLPEPEGPDIAGVPRDSHGFIPVDDHGRVRGLDDVYAAGDITAFGLKQGGLAAQQADAVAETIAASLGAPITPTPFKPVLRGLLLTGGAPLYLRAEPQHLPSRATVAIEATPIRRSLRDASAAAGQPLWWPPAKIAGRYLGPFLATARPKLLAPELLVDRVAVPGPGPTDAEYGDALALALLLAECDARWGDYPSAVSALDAAEALEGALPPEYETKRRAWRAGVPVS